MNVLSVENYYRAVAFIHTHARKLEQQLYYYHFQPIASSQQDVISELAKFLNQDGGFGHALEPDVRMNHSSVVATKCALQILIDISASSSEPLVRDGISYLLDRFDEQNKIWSLVDEEIQNAPHAPWWATDNLLTEFNQYLVNPRAGILKILLHYNDLVPNNIITEVTDSLFSHLNQLPTDLAFFDTNAFLQLLQSEKLSKEHREILTQKLSETAVSIVSKNPDDWSKFSVKPLWLVPSPIAPFYDVLKTSVTLNLHYEIDNQQKDGSWAPTWDWGDTWKDVWSIVKKEWKGIITLATLRSLRDFNLIEGLSVPSPDKNFKYFMD
ncbi:MAG TPA: hypothetical protein VMZ29_14865 [Candidatus Bathyarchaeia archaeon]|nr:hypothetical protein [Candidatus Bathyarchaeia archaeon]